MTHEIDAVRWLNTEPLDLAGLKGRVVAVYAFQMLCPGCVQHSLPQARSLHALFPPDDLAVIGLHSVFEHHRVMTPEALEVFASEFRLTFPIAIDRPGNDSPLPATMARWGLQGTPTLLLFDRGGALALKHFGHLDDLRVGAMVGELVARREDRRG